MRRPTFQSAAIVAACIGLPVLITGCLNTTTTPTQPTPAEPGGLGLDGTAQVADMRAPAPFRDVGGDPLDALDRLERAYEDRDFRLALRLLGGRFVFHTADGLGYPEELSRREALRLMRELFRDPDVLEIRLDLVAGEPEDAGDPDHPDWVEVPVEAVFLEVDRLDEFGEVYTQSVNGDPARFVLGKGPRMFRRARGWQIMSQWDLHESEEPGGERMIEWTTWSQVLLGYD